MDRRKFLKSTGLVSTAMLMPQFLRAMPGGGTSNGKILVVVQLTGGNDGLNTVIPYRNDAYYNARPQLAIARGTVLPLTDGIGLNPSMGAMRSLFDEGQLTIVNGVGYPDPDRSHFRSMDIWHTASGSEQYLETGWLGRYLDATRAKPHGVIEFGGGLSLANKGAKEKAIAIADPARFYAVTREPYFAKLAQEAHADDHTQLGYLYRTMVETYQSAGYIHENVKTKESSTIWPKNELANQLRHVSAFIRSGLETRVYYTSFSGFDTHVNQQGKHEKVLGGTSEALGAFAADLKAAGKQDDVLIMVFSEFGRRVKQNASNGTDHGTASNVFLIGTRLKKAGVFNALPSLEKLDDNGDLRFAVDFRSVYAAVLDHWLGLDPKLILTTAFDPLPVLG